MCADAGRNFMNTLPGQITLPGEVRFARLLPGPIEQVWAYLTDPVKRQTWLASGAMEAQVGGKVELEFFHSKLSPGEKPSPEYSDFEDGHKMEGVLLHYQAPRVLAFTWGGGAQKSEVTIELKPHGKQVQMVLTHRKLLDREQIESVSGGWHVHLMFLIAVLEKRKPPLFWATHAKMKGEYAKRLDVLLGEGSTHVNPKRTAKSGPVPRTRG